MPSLELEKFLSPDGFLFVQGSAVHRTAFEHIHAEWARHLHLHHNRNVDALMEVFFEAMHAERTILLTDPETF